MTIQMIPARNCVLSKTNVRRTAANPALLAQLKADIAARGVLQNLIGFGIPKRPASSRSPPAAAALPAFMN